jgi:hypothetical protein
LNVDGESNDFERAGRLLTYAQADGNSHGNTRVRGTNEEGERK